MLISSPTYDPKLTALLNSRVLLAILQAQLESAKHPGAVTLLVETCFCRIFGARLDLCEVQQEPHTVFVGTRNYGDLTLNIPLETLQKTKDITERLLLSHITSKLNLFFPCHLATIKFELSLLDKNNEILFSWTAPGLDLNQPKKIQDKPAAPKSRCVIC